MGQCHFIHLPVQRHEKEAVGLSEEILLLLFEEEEKPHPSTIHAHSNCCSDY